MKSPSGEKEEDKCFRVSVCLERFFSDERARCFVSVSGARRVRWLRRRLRRLFALRGRVALLARGHLLPPAEPLSLLGPDDVVHVVPTAIDLDGSESSESAIEQEETATGSPHMDRRTKKRKLNDSKEQSFCNGDDIFSTQQEVTPTPDPPYRAEVTESRHIASEPVAVEPPNLDSLDEMKERALALLDSCAAAPRRRRTRRRRRPRPSPADLPDLTDPLANSTVQSLNSPELNVQPHRIESPHPMESSNVNQDVEDNISSYGTDMVDRATSPLHSPRGPRPAAAPSSQSAVSLARVPSPAVVRNESAAPRAARLVRPLEAAPAS